MDIHNARSPLWHSMYRTPGGGVLFSDRPFHSAPQFAFPPKNGSDVPERRSENTFSFYIYSDAIEWPGTITWLTVIVEKEWYANEGRSILD
jgi:hypothetical protein